jgi:hypothetical protein
MHKNRNSSIIDTQADAFYYKFNQYDSSLIIIIKLVANTIYLWLVSKRKAIYYHLNQPPCAIKYSKQSGNVYAPVFLLTI